jgi:hypothetical protein
MDLGIRPEHLEAVRLTSPPKGIASEELDAAQRELLKNIVSVYVSRLPAELAEAELAGYDDGRLDALSFAWSGPGERGLPHYYRVQGPRLLIEYDNAQRGGNHAHSVWRDPEGDFGADVLGEHNLRTRDRAAEPAEDR